MSKLSGLFGGRKKKKVQLISTEPDGNVVNNQQYHRRISPGRSPVLDPLAQTNFGQRRVFRVFDDPKVKPTRLSELQEGSENRSSVFNSEDVKPTKPSVTQNDLGEAVPNKRVRLSLVKPTHVNTPVRKLSMNKESDETVNVQLNPACEPRRLSVLIPLTQIDQVPKQSLLQKEYNFTRVQPKRLSQLQEDRTRFSLLNPEDIKPRRTSIQQNVVESSPNKQVRLSIVKPTFVDQNTEPRRFSLLNPSEESEEFPLNPANEPDVYAVRRIKLTNKQSFPLKNILTRKRNAEEQEDGGERWEQQTDRTRNTSLVYAAPSVPTRGRTSSILQQSVKSLTSRNEEIPVPHKNIRFSRDADVFSADVKRRNERPVSPGYVTMERGQGMLVSDLLNPITSIFVTDLKDPVPKDPLRKPQEYNRWVRPRQNSMRQVVTPIPLRTNRQVRVSVAKVTTPASTMKSKPSQKYSRYESDEESSSNSDESVESYDPRPKYYKKPTHQRVYTTEMPNMVLPDVAYGNEDNKKLAVENSKVTDSPSKASLRNGKEMKLLQPPYVGRLSSAQKTDIADAINFLCNPSP